MRNEDRPVMDAANDNAPIGPDDYFDKAHADDDDDAPTGIGALSTAAGREAAKSRRENEKARMALARAAIASRQSIGDPGCADNDNEDFPLLAALRRERDNDSIDLVRKYRRLVALAECEPLQGQRVGGGLAAEYRSTNLSNQTDELFEKIEAKPASERWSGDDHVPGGEIRYKHVKKRKGGTFHLPASQAVVVNDESRVLTAPLALPFNADLLIRKIDAKPVLAEVRVALGPLLDAFEDAVLGGSPYTDIGRREGFEVKPDVAGKALVKRAIIAAEGVLYEIEKRLAKAERESERRATARRLELEVERTRYLGRAA